MEQFNRKKHWEHIYQNKPSEAFSWYQPIPKTSIELFTKLHLPKSAKIIDIGGGDSFFVDYLIEIGYQHITVLDISKTAIEKAQNRLGNKANGVKWIIADVCNFQLSELYDFWHDRAAFHFLTNETEINHYVERASNSIATNGKMVIGTFSENGPKKCSGIEITQYSERRICHRFGDYFDPINYFTTDHITGTGAIQNFIFCSFQKK